MGAFWAFLIVGALIAFFVVSLQLRRHGESQLPSEDWERTDEVFRDPTTKRFMRVWVDPRDGSRHYVPEPGPPPSV